jgi:hypothetical protein
MTEQNLFKARRIVVDKLDTAFAGSHSDVKTALQSTLSATDSRTVFTLHTIMPELAPILDKPVRKTQRESAGAFNATTGK